MAFAYRSSSIGNLLCTATGWSPQTTQLQVGFVLTVTAWAVGFAFSFQNKLRVFFHHKLSVRHDLAQLLLDNGEPFSDSIGFELLAPLLLTTTKPTDTACTYVFI